MVRTSNHAMPRTASNSAIYEIAPPIMIACDRTVGLTAGHTDV